MIDPNLHQLGLMLFEIQKYPQTSNRIKAFKKYLKSYDDNPALASLWVWMLSPYVTFGLSTIPKVKRIMDYEKPAGLIGLLGQLSNRTLSGDKAKTAVIEFWEQLDPTERRGFLSIIEKDPRCRMQRKTVNKIIPGLIPDFSVSKPVSWKHRSRDARALCNKSGGAIIDKKMNGLRRIYVRDADVLLSGSGIADEVFPFLNRHLKQIVAPGTVLDCELVHNTLPLKDLAGLARSKTPSEDEDVTLWVFDVMTTEDWHEQKNSTPQFIRTEWVQTADWGDGPVKPVPSYSAFSDQQMDSIYYRLIDEGEEGIIIKNPSKPYAFKRSNCWVKRKREESVDVPIVGLEEGTGKFKGTLGKFKCVLPDGIEFTCSGKLTEEMRDHIWLNPNQYIGRIIEVVYQERTPRGSLQHPNFFRFRDDKVIP